MRYLIGCCVTVAISALILSCSGANSLSTMMTPSAATATVMLPPWPSSMYMLSPSSVVLISTFEKSTGGGDAGGAGCAVAAPASSIAVASAAHPVRFMTISQRETADLLAQDRI